MKTRRLIILVGIVLMAFAASGCGYNTLTTKHENVKSKWAGVETQLQRRGDLLNNLTEAAKMAGVQEQEVFGTIATARCRTTTQRARVSRLSSERSLSGLGKSRTSGLRKAHSRYRRSTRTHCARTKTSREEFSTRQRTSQEEGLAPARPNPRNGGASPSS